MKTERRKQGRSTEIVRKLRELTLREVRGLLVQIRCHLGLFAKHLSIKAGVVKVTLAELVHLFGHTSLQGSHRLGKAIGQLTEIELLHLNQRSGGRGEENR